MYRSVVAVVLLLLLLPGCAAGLGAPSVEASKTISQARTVGVISAVGHKFAVQKIGLTVFGNELKEVPIGSWGIDDAVAKRVGSLLGRRFTVRRVRHSAQDLDAAVENVIREVGAAQKHDIYIVVTRSSAPYGSTNQVMTGLGIVHAGSFINPDNVALYAITAVQVYDGRTFERLASLRTGSSTLFSEIGGDHDLPYRKLDRTWWPETAQAAAHSAKLKTATRALLNESLARTIPAIMGIETRSARGKKATWSPFKR